MKTNGRFYLDCPYEDKDECKQLGAYWDSDKRKWYVPSGLGKSVFKKWWPGENPEYREPSSDDDDGDRFYLTVDFGENEDVKSRGARWDARAKRWFVPSGEDKEKFKAWWPMEVATEEAPF